MKSKLILMGVVVVVLLSLVACSSAAKQGRLSRNISHPDQVNNEDTSVSGAIRTRSNSHSCSGFRLLYPFRCFVGLAASFAKHTTGVDDSRVC